MLQLLRGMVEKLLLVLSNALSIEPLHARERLPTARMFTHVGDRCKIVDT
jgi:hypothetical protein